MFKKEYLDFSGYFMGDPEMNIYGGKEEKEDLGKFNEGIYKTKQGDTFVVGERERISIQEFKKGEIEKRNLRYLKLIGKIVVGEGEMKVEEDGKGKKVTYKEIGKEDRDIFSGIKRVH